MLALAIACAWGRSPWGYRIAGSGTRGRLEVRPDNTTVCGTVCDDSFDASDAAVACRSIGYTGSNEFYRAGGGSGPIYMDDLECSGTEVELSECRFTRLVNCGHSEDIGIGCTGPLSPTPPPGPPPVTTLPPRSSWEYRIDGNGTRGRLEVRPDNTSAWGTVCDDFFTFFPALVACRSVGFSTSLEFYRAGGGSGPIWMDDVVCTGYEQELAQCQFVFSSDCVHTEDVGISCAPPTTVSPATPPPGFAVGGGSLWEYRLDGGRSEGRLEVRPNGSAPWGTVCEDSFTAPDAAVACRSVGQSTDKVAYYVAGGGAGPIYMEGVRCTGAEAALADCSYAVPVNCTHAQDVGVRCRRSVPVAAIVVPIVLGVLLVAAAIAAVVWWRRRGNKKLVPADAEHADAPMGVVPAVEAKK